MDRFNAAISLDITKTDGEIERKFARFSLEYSDVKISDVLMLEEKMLAFSAELLKHGLELADKKK